jgi:type VI secretion system protein ImpC
MATEISQEKTVTTPEVAYQEVDDFSALLKQSFKPRSERAATEVDNAINTLVQQALADTSLIKDDVLDTIEEMIARLDEKLSDQINAIIHAHEFQSIESAWRGLSYLVYNSETDATLKLKIMNVSKNELYRDLRNYPDAKWDQSPLFKKIYEAEFGQLGGEPFGCLVGDYYFDQSAVDVRLLRDLGKIAASAHCPFIAGAAPALMGMDTWTELSNPRDLSKIFETPDYAAWKSLRDSENSRYMALCMPRVLARDPFGAKTVPVEDFNFEEETDGHKGEKYAWMNAAYAMAANINRAYKEYGWTVRIRGVQSGGEVINLPTHTFPTDDGDIDLKCPTEIAISDRREAELSKSGLLPLIHRKNSDKAAFIGAQSLYRPKKYDNVDATASDNISSRIPYMFAVSRFSHYLKCMVRDQIGETKERDELQKWLQKWITQYVDGDPKNSSIAQKAKKPLADAKVEVFEDEENPGYYSARFYLRPHFQLEGMDIGMSLVSRLPGQKSK